MLSFQDETGLNGLRACIALGMFDGVHKGHAALLHACINKARQMNVPAVLYTYRNSPHPDKQSKVRGYLTPETEKLSLCKAMGIDLAVTREFTAEYRHTPPYAFADLLFQNGRSSALFCGNDYRFGYHGRGTPELLRELGRQKGVDVVCVEDVLFDGSPISSSRIRSALLQGDCLLAQALLGRPYGVEVRFQKGLASFPSDKARLAEGTYQCGFEGIEMLIHIAEDGLVYALDPSCDEKDGRLLFLQKTEPS